MTKEEYILYQNDSYYSKRYYLYCKSIICPYCDEVQCLREILSRLEDEKEHRLYCQRCNNIYRLIPKFEFSTKRLDKEAK